MKPPIIYDTPFILAEQADDIAGIARKLGDAASRAGGLSWFYLALPGGMAQWVAVTKPFGCQAGDLNEQPEPHVRSDVTVAAAATFTPPLSQGDGAEALGEENSGGRKVKTSPPQLEIRAHIERALGSFAIVSDLQHNPLVNLLDLSAFAKEDDNALVAGGLALKRALHAAIGRLKQGPEEDRVAGRYLEARFVSRLSEQRASAYAGVSVRTTNRKRGCWLDRLLSILIHPDV